MTYTARNGTDAVIRDADGMIVGPENTAEWAEYQAWVAGGGAVVPYAPPPVDLPAYAAAVRFAKETGGIAVSGASIETDRASQAMISGAYSFAKDNPNASIDFKASSGFVTLTSAQMVSIGQAVAVHVQACFSTEKTVAAGIAAGSITTPAQIDAAFAT